MGAKKSGTKERDELALAGPRLSSKISLLRAAAQRPFAAATNFDAMRSRSSQPPRCRAAKGASLLTGAPDLVAALGCALRQRIGESRYQLWFHDKTHFVWADGQLTVGVPNHFYQDWLEKSFGEQVKEAAVEVFGETPVVRFAIDARLFQTFRKKEEGAAAPAASYKTDDKPAAIESKPAPATRAKARPRQWRSLADFVTGACNRVAHAAAQALLEDAGQESNLLVLHGPVGTGKSHLLEGIYQGLRHARPDAKIMFLTAEDFTNRFVQAMYHGKLSAFRKQFRECDALLIDDVHFLAKKPATQEEFLHTYDALRANDAQVVLTCDCHPRLSEQFMPELTDRLLGGGIWGLSFPEKETRLDLLRQKSRTSGREPLSEEVIEFLAEQLRGNVRELEGALHSLYHFARVHAKPIDRALAREALGDVLRHSAKIVQIADIEKAVAAALSITPSALQSKQRGWSASHPRMLAMYLARKHTSATYAEIGNRFGGRNHSTAVAGEKKVKDWLRENGTLQTGERQVYVRDLVERIERDLLK